MCVQACNSRVELRAYEGICRLLDYSLVDVAGEKVPRVPTHLWSEAKTIVQRGGAQDQRKDQQQVQSGHCV